MLCGNFERKNGFKKGLPTLPSHRLIKAEIALAEAGRAFPAF